MTATEVERHQLNVLLPVRLYLALVERSIRSRTSKAEIVAKALEAYLKGSK